MQPSSDLEPLSSGSPSSGGDRGDDTRVERWEQRFFWPVIGASIAAIPAMFLTMLEGLPATAGEAINFATMAVFAAETAVLLLLARDKRRWLREHWFIVTITAITIPAVILALGPVQVLRLVRVVGALRIIRVGRILKAGRILYERAGFSGPIRRAVGLGVTVLAALFVALVLADPSAQSRQLLEDVFGDAWLVAVLVAGLVLGAATYVVARFRGGEEPPETSDQRSR